MKLLLAATIFIFQITSAWQITTCKGADGCTGDGNNCITTVGSGNDCYRTNGDARSILADYEGCTELAVYSDDNCVDFQANWDDIAGNKFCFAGTDFVTNSYQFLC